MKKQILNEVFNIKSGNMKKKDGSTVKIIYIDPQTSENTYQYKDTIKTRFKGNWLSNIKAWGWFAGSNPQMTIDNYVKPCLEFLLSVETNENNESRDIVKLIDKLINELNSGNIVEKQGVETALTSEQVKERLEQFKRDLINCTSSEEFKTMLGPIIKFKRAAGRDLSWPNTIFIWIQNNKTSMVKSRKHWLAVNRTIKDGARALWIYAPINLDKLSKKEKEKLTNDFLNSRGVATVEDLSIRDKEELDVMLRGKDSGNVSFVCIPGMYAFEDTVQMDGKEDMVGNPNVSDDIKWFDGDSKETDESRRLTKTLISVIQDLGVKINYVSDLGGARGVSKSGSIDLLQGEPFSIGFFDTLVHEFSHELLHQKYLQSTNDELKGYFIGTKQGRAVVEQQAELSAWIVLRNYGYDMPTDINYVGIWGLDEKNAVQVFDSVSNVAMRIVKEINKRLDNVNESINKMIMESFLPSGKELANLLGFGKVYEKSELMQNNESYNDSDMMDNEDSQVRMESIRRDFINKFNLIENTIKNNFIR